MRSSNRLNLRKILQSTEVKRRLLFTVVLLALFRIGVYIPLPAIPKGLISGDDVLAGQLANAYDLFAGGALKSLSIFALGIGPYINASIIIQLLTPVVPRLKQLREEGHFGQRTLKRTTRWLTLVLALVESLMLGVKLTARHAHEFMLPDPIFVAITAMLLTASAMLVMFLSENITEHGIGNGASLLICAGILSRVPGMVQDTYLSVQAGQTSVWSVAIMVLALTAFAYGAAMLQNCVKKITVSGGRSSRKQKSPAELLLPFNPSGVMPIVFAAQFMFFLGLVNSFLSERTERFSQFLANNTATQSMWLWFTSNGVVRSIVSAVQQEIENCFVASRWEYAVLYAGLIIYFAVFYSSIVLPPKEIAEALRKDNRAIVGVKPGRPTTTFLNGTIRRLSLVGATALACMAIVPLQLAQWTQVQTLMGFGSTSLMILTGVALDTQRQVTAYAVTSQYHTKQILPRRDQAENKDEEA